MDEALKDKIGDIVQSVMGIDIYELDKKLKFNQIKEWDSFNNLMLISKFQDELGLEFTAIEIENTQNIGDLLVLVESKVSSKKIKLEK